MDSVVDRITKQCYMIFLPLMNGTFSFCRQGLICHIFVMFYQDTRVLVSNVLKLNNVAIEKILCSPKPQFFSQALFFSFFHGIAALLSTFTITNGFFFVVQHAQNHQET